MRLARDERDRERAAQSERAVSGPLGLGWSLEVPFIARQSDRGMPRYVDGPAWQGEEDRFFYNGGQELVPVDSAAIEIADCGAPGCAPVPTELAGWQQYRARVEGGFLRFFRAPDGRRWVVHAPDGSRFDFGALPAGDGPGEAVVRSVAALHSELPAGQGRVYRWLITRVADPHGSTIYHLHDEHEGQRYLADVYYTSPHGSCGELADSEARRRCAAPLTDYGRRVHFVYGSRPDVQISFASGWQIRTARRLRRVELTSAEGAPGARTLVRRYHLGYHPASFWSLLATVELEGRPSSIDPITGAVIGRSDLAESALGEAYVGKRLAPIRLSYTTQPASFSFAPGFGGTDATVHSSPTSPPWSVGANADLFDVNSDGLADLVVTDPAHFQTSGGDPAVGVYFNGFAGAAASPASAGSFSGPVLMPMRSDLGNVLRLTNANLSPMDVDGDGRSDYQHLPRTASTGYFTPVRGADASASVSPAQQGWRWAYLKRLLPANDPDPRIDFAHDGARLRQFDVNNDHLVDVVRTTGNSMQIWLNLGWVAGGDGRYGHATWQATTGTYALSTAPIETCLPVAGVPLDFADPEVHLGDLNGDGLTDIAKIRDGQVIYWPGRGAAGFGVGSADCPAGLTPNRHVEMATPPAELDPETEGVHLADVNADGVDDLLRVRYDEVDVWFNRAGHGFTPRVRLAETPFAPAFDTRVRLVDVDGSGTLDIVYARADAWQWVDPMGGRRPRLLASVDNSFGARTELRHESSVADYLADLAEAAACTGAGCERHDWSGGSTGCDAKVQAATGECVRRSGGSPVITTIVRQVDVSDRLDALGMTPTVTTTRFRYHDGYYEGIEQELRGFGMAETIRIGDANQPTMIERVSMHQGRRADRVASDRLADNPDEALKGAIYASESFDAAGRYLGGSHRTYTLRRVAVGLSGVAVMHAYASQFDVLSYDTGAFVPSTATLALPGVVRPGGTESHEVRLRGAGYAHMRATTEEIDGLGHALQSTAHGRVRGEHDEPLPDERVVQHATWVNVAGTETRWLWRAHRGHVDGHGDPAPLRETTVSHSPGGDVLRTVQKVRQPVSPRFEGDAESEGYGTPVPEDVVTSTVYDVWGNELLECAGGDAWTISGCLRLGLVTYDPDYSLTPVEQGVATKRTSGGGIGGMVTTATWDRGLMTAIQVVDPNGEITSVSHDGLGRATLSRAPDVAGCAGSWPQVRVTYVDPENPVTTPVTRVRLLRFFSCTDATDTLETIAYADGHGRTRAVLSSGEDASTHRWVKSGVFELDRRGSVRRSYQPSWFAGDPGALTDALARPSLTPASQSRYDAFGRVVATIAEDGAATLTVHHALSFDVHDPLDLASDSAFRDTPLTVRSDGHGRTIDKVLRNRQPGTDALEIYRLFIHYRADGGIVRVERAQTKKDAPAALTGVVAGRRVVRHFFLDSIGRRVATTDPDSDDPATGATWRYLFNRVGDLVAVRDPRDCGANFYVDLAGRPLGEAYVGCAEAQEHEAPVASLAWGIGLTELSGPRAVDVLHVYDGYQGAWAPTPEGLDDFPAHPGGLIGHVAATIDRGRRSLYAYDRRGNAIWEARQLALVPEPGPPAPSLPGQTPAPPPPTDLLPDRAVAFDEAHSYVRTAAFDHGNRARGVVLPPDPDFAPGQLGPRVTGTMDFDRRSLPRRARLGFVSGGGVPVVANGVLGFGGATVDLHTVIDHAAYTRDGLLSGFVLGDDADGTRSPTRTTVDHDVRRRLVQSLTLRAPTGAGLPGERPLSAVTVVHAQGLHWDDASNLIAIDDLRLPGEWPAGHKPQLETVQHDALYRVVGVEYEYTQDDGSRTPDDDGTDWRAEQERVRDADPMRRAPAPMLPALPQGRVASQTWQFDWLGNTTHWGDDAHAFHERSIGTIVNGADLDSVERPGALHLAAELDGSNDDRGGWLELDYGVGGQVTAMTVHAQCRDAGTSTCADPGGSLAGRRATLREQCACEREQHYQYRWDELGRLAEARRYDRSDAIGEYALEVQQRYRYDAGNVRTLKQTFDRSGDAAIALYVYPGDFERRGLRRGEDRYLAASELGTESEYLVAGARVVWKAGGPASGVDANHRITYAIGDLLGSTSAVVDLRTGELTQVGTFYPNGGRETLLGSAGSELPFEPIGFTGKEDDQEVGLVYFGERYLLPGIGRWASPDPLHVHALGGGELGNGFHYVSGSLVQARDPLGLDAGGRGPVPEPTEEDGVKHGRDLADIAWKLDEEASRMTRACHNDGDCALAPGRGITLTRDFNKTIFYEHTIETPKNPIARDAYFARWKENKAVDRRPGWKKALSTAKSGFDSAMHWVCKNTNPCSGAIEQRDRDIENGMPRDVAIAKGIFLLGVDVFTPGDGPRGPILIGSVKVKGGGSPARHAEIQPNKWSKVGEHISSIDDAATTVRGGGDVFAKDKSTAYKIAEKAGDGAPEHDGPHGDAQHPHFHPMVGGQRSGGHVMY